MDFRHLLERTLHQPCSEVNACSKARLIMDQGALIDATPVSTGSAKQVRPACDPNASNKNDECFGEGALVEW
jgi:hypothetical protein